MRPAEFSISEEASKILAEQEAWQAAQQAWEENEIAVPSLCERDVALDIRRRELIQKVVTARDEITPKGYRYSSDASPLVYMTQEEETEIGSARLAAYLVVSSANCSGEPDDAGVKWCLIYDKSKPKLGSFMAVSYEEQTRNDTSNRTLTGQYVKGTKLRHESTNGVGSRRNSRLMTELNPEQLDSDEAMLASIEESVAEILKAAQDQVLNPTGPYIED